MKNKYKEKRLRFNFFGQRDSHVFCTSIVLTAVITNYSTLLPFRKNFLIIKLFQKVVSDY